ncbi:MAG: UDP-N-acetylglucosamine--N-acetylmuramyl-(pentapeptide) pyrophosphoryl-undecaprenol N-acetylglucosamine transferase, partial [Muribaculaceae bacterium]|nr:UDP-N-acetylglucosamine--N-acetylmuramyl-(pentapeptide) pyrophosphoryl-undecaprenol N-acetylglucosamine transferase [Muribaculaceae bacterium]
ILVPSPNVAEDHQRKNAEALANRAAAIMILDADCRSNLGKTIIDLLDNEAKRTALSQNALKMALPNADALIVDRALELINSKNQSK